MSKIFYCSIWLLTLILFPLSSIASENKKIAGIKLELNTDHAFKKTDIIIDFTVPKCTLEILKIASKLKKRVVIGTTGFTQKEEDLIKKRQNLGDWG